MVRRPEQREEIRSLPAREVTMVFMALALDQISKQPTGTTSARVPRDSRTMISRKHEHHLDKLGSSRLSLKDVAQT